MGSPPPWAALASQHLCAGPWARGGGRRGRVWDGPLQAATRSPAGSRPRQTQQEPGRRSLAACARPHLLLHRKPRCSREAPRPSECASSGFWAAGLGWDGALQVPAAPWLRDALSPTLSLPSFPMSDGFACPRPPPTRRRLWTWALSRSGVWPVSASAGRPGGLERKRPPPLGFPGCLRRGEPPEKTPGLGRRHVAQGMERTEWRPPRTGGSWAEGTVFLICKF